MPFMIPILIGGAIILAGAVGGMVLAEYLKDSERKLALVGRQSAGKSTFLYILEHDKVPSNPLPPTTEQQATKVTIGESTVVVIDSGGDETRLSDWKRALDDSDDVLYFFDASVVASGDRRALAAIEADVDHIRRWRATGCTASFMLIGTHSDLCSPDQLSAINRHPLINKLKDASGTRAQDVAFGSLVSKRDARSLAKAIVHRLEAAA